MVGETKIEIRVGVDSEDWGWNEIFKLVDEPICKEDYEKEVLAGLVKRKDCGATKYETHTSDRWCTGNFRLLKTRKGKEMIYIEVAHWKVTGLIYDSNIWIDKLFRGKNGYTFDRRLINPGKYELVTQWVSESYFHFTEITECRCGE